VLTDLFPLPLFPPASLDSSVTTTVWIGVLVVAFFNLRWGWIFSGLVVPGYIVPLLLSRPISAAVIFFEAILVYLIARAISDLSPRRAPWSSLFGRDRFFFLVLVSVIVRLVFDGWMLPRAAVLFEQELGWSLDLGNELHSFGLVIVALMANHLWKPGLVAGLAQSATTVGITLLVVRFVLMEWTNFDLGALEYMYEDIAASILASPKAYIMLLTTAFIASRLNLLYGWEYSGVLIPALLALQWYQPTKLLASIVEAWAVLLVSSALLESRWFRGATVEKASKVALFFTVSYLYKFVLAYGVSWLQPELKVSDLYGFGYLLPSLLAVKMHEKSLGLRMTRFTLQTTLVSAAVALLVGFSLTLVPRQKITAESLAPGPLAKSTTSTETHWSIEIMDARVEINAAKGQASFDAPTAAELALFSDAMSGLLDYARGPSGSEPIAAIQALSAIGYRVDRVSDQHLLIRELDPSRGWGYFNLRLGEASELFFTVPRPLDEWATAQAGATLYERFRARGVAVAGTGGGVGSADASRRADTVFDAFHRIVGRGVVQVRARGVSTDLRIAPDPSSTVWVKSELAEGLDLRDLEEWIGPFGIEWARRADPTVQWQHSRGEFVELGLTRSARHRLLIEPSTGIESPAPRPYDQPIEGYLHRWLLSGKGRIAGRGSDAYLPPTLAELIFFDEEVLTPVVQLVRFGYHDGELDERALPAWRRASLAASLFGYELIWYRHVGSGRDYVILQESDPIGRYWGTFVFRLGEAFPYVLSVPRPRSERRTFEVGVTLFDQLQASTLIVAGSHPYANNDATSDLIRPDNKVSLFNLVHQVLLRETPRDRELVVLFRAFADRGEADDPDAMLAMSDGTFRFDQLDALSKRLVSTLQAEGIAAEYVDGTPRTASYEAGVSPQLRYLDQTQGKKLAVLWLSAATRSTFRVESDERLRTRALDALGLATEQEDIREFLQRVEATQYETPSGVVLDLMSHYVETADPLALRRLIADYPWIRARRVIDLDSPRSFLVLTDPDGRLVAAANLQLRSASDPVIAEPAALRSAAEEFVRRRRALLVVRGGP